MTRIALVTGVTGQDGAYLSQWLLSQGYQVYGAYRRSSSVNFWRLQELGLLQHPHLTLVEYDLTDPGASIRLLQRTNPTEVYNLAAQSFVGVSFDQPVTTSQINAMGCLHLLEAIRIVNPEIRFYQASTSEMYGQVQSVPQNEQTPFYPRSPYGVSKLFAHWMTINYRESYNLFATSGILFNHESPLRGLEFVTRKITHTLVSIQKGQADRLELGNLDAQRDWGYAPEYVQGMWKMLQSPIPDTYVLATGKTHTVRDFINLAAQALDMPLTWEGSGVTEQARDTTTGKVIVSVNPAYYRPSEVDLLIGDPTKASQQLDWRAGTSLQTLCELMVRADYDRHTHA